MRILFVSPEYPPNIKGGVGIYLYHLSLHLNKLSKPISAEVLTFSGETEIGKGLKQLPFKVIKLRRILPYKLRIIEFYIRANFFLCKRKNVKNYDFIHDNYNMVVLGKAPVIHTVHSTMLQEYWCSEPLADGSFVARAMSFIEKAYFLSLHLIEKIAFKRAHGFIVPSEELKEHLKTYFNVQKNIFVVKHGVDTSLFRPGADLSTQRKYNIAFVGRLAPRKGVKYLFKALELLETRPLRILFCNADVDAIFPYIQKLRINPRHQFHFKDSANYLLMPSLYRDSDMVVLPSIYESFSLTAVEALATATPIVMAGAGGPRRMFKDGSGAIFVPPRNPESLAQNISYLLDHARERINIGIAGRKMVLREFGWTQSAQATYDVYARLRRGP